MTIKPRHRPALLLLLILSLFLTAGCDHVPFMPRQEIDKFPATVQNLETMVVEGVTYVRVINPARQGDPEAEPAIWIPQTVYRKGNYQAYTVNLPRPREKKELQAAAGQPENTKKPSAGESSGETTTEAENQTAEDLGSTAAAPILPLRRRALLFPTQVSLRHPEIITQLEIELEKTLPLRVVENFNPRLNEAGRLLTRPQEIRKAVRQWLKKTAAAPPVQFVLFLVSRTGRDRSYFTCNWIDAQTGNPVAAFTFIRDFQGQLWYPLVPSDPVPLVNLVNATPWWCRIERDPSAENQYILDAGHRSDLLYGRELQVFTRAEKVRDPGTGKDLGYAFSHPLGTVAVVDFFGSDGSLARARSALPENFTRGFAVEIPRPPVAQEAPEKSKEQPKDHQPQNQ